MVRVSTSDGGTPFGATEAMPLTTMSGREIVAETAALSERGLGMCVGRPLPGVTVRVIRITDAAIPAWDDALPVAGTGPDAGLGAIGEIVVKGPVVTRTYLNRPAKTALAKITDADGDIWHRIGDVGYFDDRGRLWFCGRKAHRVTTPDGVIFPVPCETIFNHHPGVNRTALVGVGAEGHQRPVLVVEPQMRPGRTGHTPTSLLEKQRFTLELLALGAEHAHTQTIRDILFYPKTFPTDVRHNAKIQREKLAAWAAKHLHESLQQKTASPPSSQPAEHIPPSRRIGDLFRALSILLSVMISILFISRRIRKRNGMNHES